LGGNELTHIPKDALSTLEFLKKLEMQENRIPEIRVGELGGKETRLVIFTSFFDHF